MQLKQGSGNYLNYKEAKDYEALYPKTAGGYHVVDWKRISEITNIQGRTIKPSLFGSGKINDDTAE